MKKQALPVSIVVGLVAVLAMVSAGPADQASRGRRGPWVECPAEEPIGPSKPTTAYSAEDERRMAQLQAEVIARVEAMNSIVRRTTGKPGPDGPVVQFTMFAGCPEGSGGNVMMEFLQAPTETEASFDSFFDVWVDVGPGDGGGGGGSGGCHCEANMVSCEGACPC